MTTEELLLKINGDASGAQDAVKGLSVSFEGLFGTITEGIVSGELLSEAIAKVGEVLKELPGELLELGERGSQVADVETAFRRLSGGIEAAEENLTALRAGTRGTVDDFELMKVANKSLSDGAKLSADDFGVMAAGARLLAKQSGGETTDALETLNQAMVSGRTRALNLIGVHVDADAAMARYAATIGESVSDFTNQEKVAATSAEVMRQLKIRLQEAGDQQLSLKERVDAVTTAFANFDDDLGKAIAQSPVLTAGFNAIGKEMDTAFGGREPVIKGIVKVVETLAILSTDAASAGVTGLQVVGDAVFGFEQIYYEAVAAMSQRLLDMVLPARAAAEVFKDVPGMAGDAFKVANVGMDKLIGGIGAVSASAKQWDDDMVVGGLKWDASMTQLQGSIGRVQANLLLAAAAGEKAGQAGAKGAQDTGDGWSKASPALEEFEKKLQTLTTTIETATANHMALDQEVALYGKEAAKAAAEAQGWGVTVSAAVKKVADAYDLSEVEKMWAKTHEQLTAIANKFVEDGIAAIQKANAKEADLRAQAVTDQLAIRREYEDKLQDLTLSGVNLQLVQIERARDAAIAAETKKAQVTGESYDVAKARVDAYYDRLKDEALGTADTIDERMRKQGVFTKAELQDRADNARRDYEQMLDEDGAFTDAAIRNAKRTADEAQAAADGTRTTWDKTYGALGDVSTILGNIPGKFSEIAQVAARTGQAIMKNLADGNVWGAVVAGITGAVQALGKLLNIGTAGRDAVLTFANSFGGFDVLHEKLDALGASGEQLWVKLTQGVGKNDPAAAKAVIDDITKALDNQKQSEDALLQSQNQQLGDLLKGLDGLGAGDLLQPYLDKLADAKGLTGDNLALIKQLGGDGSVSFDQMQKAASALGISTDRLGKSFQAAKQQADWQSIIDNLDTLVRGGADLNDLLGDEGLQKKIQDLVSSSLQFGTTIPENAKPWIQSLIDQGKLLDASGNKITDINKLNFGESLQTSVQKLVDKIGELIDKISAVPGALDKIPPSKTVTVTFDGKKTGDWSGAGGDSGDTVGAAATGAFVTAAGLVPLALRGGGLVPPNGTDTIPAWVSPGELILNAVQQQHLSSALQGDAGVTVNFHEGAIDASGSMFTDTSGMRKLASVIGDEIARRYKQSYRVSTR